MDYGGDEGGRHFVRNDQAAIEIYTRKHARPVDDDLIEGVAYEDFMAFANLVYPDDFAALIDLHHDFGAANTDGGHGGGQVEAFGVGFDDFT